MTGSQPMGSEATGSASARDGAQNLGAQISVVGGNPTAAEVAAVTAVLAATLEEARGNAAAQDRPVISAWQRSQRPLRRVLHPGAGQWRGFSG